MSFTTRRPRKLAALVWVLLFPWAGAARAAEYYSFSPGYHLTGALDVLYLSDRLDAGGSESRYSSLSQRYVLGLTGPLYGPYLGVFSLNARLLRNDLTVNDESANARLAGFGGSGILLPTGKLPLSFYFDISSGRSDQFGLATRTDTGTWGLALGPRVFRGTTLLTWDQSSIREDVEGRNTFDDSRGRGSLLYRDGRRLGKETTLDYQYQFTLTRDRQDSSGTSQSTTGLGNSLQASLSTVLGKKASWLNSLSANYVETSGTGADSSSNTSGAFGSLRFESNLSYRQSRDVWGFMKLNHLTLHPPGGATTNADTLTATANWENVRNPVPRLLLNLSASAGVARQWDASQSPGGASFAATTLFPALRFLDILNDVIYSYSWSYALTSGAAEPLVPTAPSGEPAALRLTRGYGETSCLPLPAACGGDAALLALSSAAPDPDPAFRSIATDSLAYRFGLRSKGGRVSWYADGIFQKEGVFTHEGAGTQVVASVGEQISGRRLFNQSQYTYTRTDRADGDAFREHRFQLISTFRPTYTSAAVLQGYLLDTTTSSAAAGTRTASRSGILDLSVNWSPASRIGLGASAAVSQTKLTAGDSSGYRLQGTLSWLLQVLNLRVLYRYEAQNQSGDVTGDFRTREHRVELQASTSFEFPLGSFVRRRK
ncbi:MAG: hypothetical protein PT977_07930 [Acidobacteriota bacterium]|nr:hypothetical protein [Acidobacteriota bacterium]